MSRPPISVTAWTGDYRRCGPVTALQQLDTTWRHNAPGDAAFTVDADHPRVDDLVRDGARCTIDYRYGDTAAEAVRFSGRVTERKASGRRDTAVRTFDVEDDWQVLNHLIGYPNPTGTEAQQGDDGAYWTRNAPAEDVVCEAVAVNAQRAGAAIVVPGSSGRGGRIAVSLRMHPLSDRLFPLVDQAGIGVRIVQRGAQRVLEVYEPQTYARVLTERSGVIAGDPELQITPPTVTHVVVGAGGEGEARLFRRFAGTPEQRKAAGDVLELFVDARDIAADDPDVANLLQARADQALLEGAGRQGVKVPLAESPGFRYGRTFLVGDRVSVQAGGGPVLTDYVREVHLTWTPEDGVLVVPLLGDWSDVSDVLYSAVAANGRKVRDMERR